MINLMVASILILLTSLQVGFNWLTFNPSTTPTVNTGYATYLGNHSLPNTVAYLGIPYAEPPLGEDRFRAPQPLNTTRIQQHRGPVDATEYPPFCVQGSRGFGDYAGGAGSEDCLKVNIYAPIDATNDSKLPVLVYIHGGGYIFGNPSSWPFDHWIDQSPNVVIVSVYYRLTVFGFLSHPALSDPALGTLNAGFLDQIQALRWVKEHISAFGGDPSRITINGESAGASSVELHLIAREGREPLFTGAIAQSVFRIGLPTPEQQVPLFDNLLQNTSCALGTIERQMSCLRNASVSSLIRSADFASHFFLGPYRLWIPVVDKDVITDYPTRLILDGKWAKVPIMAGATSNETLSFGEPKQDLKVFFPKLTDDDIQDFLDMYPERDFGSTKERHDTITGDPEFRCGRELLAGAAVTEGLPAFAYRYNQPNPTFQLPNVVGVYHAAENWMMFLGSNAGSNGSVVFTGLDPVGKAFSEELIAYWLSFVRSSNPNTYKLDRSPEWPSFVPAGSLHQGSRQVLQQDPQNSTTTSGVQVEEEPQVDIRRCKFVFGKADVLAN